MFIKIFIWRWAISSILFFQTTVRVSLFRRGRPEGKNESEIIDYILIIMRDVYGEDKIIYRFFKLHKRNKNEIFLYLNGNQTEKTSDKTGQHFSIMS
ncbi:MAG: hypothetical protein ACYCR7_01860 [Thermoplasmataceae archaeon]